MLNLKYGPTINYWACVYLWFGDVEDRVANLAPGLPMPTTTRGTGGARTSTVAGAGSSVSPRPRVRSPPEPGLAGRSA
jgi:hypothetical protein